ncbi:putative ribosome biogenesis GTPase RsgA [Aureimonas sp. SA4125]|uniref:ribosome small subunit-dependent GTPase A n=1 Tax=Aureimonas sp. SA4125 TaxID=2826993 RepID=UPI001CC39DDC|nr:ribosome small subunit-dependent GTPase A [Aureimonas sp. SA4125]BDA86926.1 putative ribosome biogenesis GTPase RsgA [Aureimonas sp. SA4125]
MTDPADPPVSPDGVPLSPAILGWSEFFEAQLGPEDADLVPRRIANVHRARLTALSPGGTVRLVLPPHANTGDYAVGDWVLVDPGTQMLRRRLDRRTVLERRIGGAGEPQLAAANVDTLFIVTSCNADFNPARLERYLALANQAGTEPVILLTKADMIGQAGPEAGHDAGEAGMTAEDYRTKAGALQRGLPVIFINPRADDAPAVLAPWCGEGRTVALVGSSGVGKSTLVNTLAGPGMAAPQVTGGIREQDAKGRHTTTARSLHAIAGGGWVIDTPGMRTLHVSDSGYGLDTLFAEITELAPRCKFRDCTHAHEPGCAVQAAIREGVLDPDRLTRWRKLQGENTANTPVQTGPRGNRVTAPRGRKR